jgi:hypothetical protein
MKSNDESGFLRYWPLLFCVPLAIVLDHKKQTLAILMAASILIFIGFQYSKGLAILLTIITLACGGIDFVSGYNKKKRH